MLALPGSLDVKNSDWPRNQWTRCVLWLQVNISMLGRYLLATKTILSTWEALIGSAFINSSLSLEASLDHLGSKYLGIIFEPILETLWNENLPAYPQPLWKTEGRLGLYKGQCNQRWQKMREGARAALTEALQRPRALPTGRAPQDTSSRQQGGHVLADSFYGPAYLAWGPQTTSSWCSQPESVIGNFHPQN